MPELHACLIYVLLGRHFMCTHFRWCISAHISAKEKNVFPCTWKCICGIEEFAWSSLGIFIVFTSSRSRTCMLHQYGQHVCGKVAHRAAFLCTGKVPASGNAFMEMVTDKCTRTTFLLMEMCTWKAGLSLERSVLWHLLHNSPISTTGVQCKTTLSVCVHGQMQRS